jgi:predicted ArsR family transcriptional regulator
MDTDANANGNANLDGNLDGNGDAPDADADQQLAGLAGLGDPLRRALYRYVADRGVPVSRDDAAQAAGIGRPLAAYHLDRLVADGLLQASYQRRGGRRGPGAGRPAKHYARAARQVQLSLPARDYAALAQLLAHAVEADPSGAARAALHRAAAALGTQLGAEAADRAAPDGDPGDPDGDPGGDPGGVLASVRQALARRGYEPHHDPDGADGAGGAGGAGGAIRLRNCPFDRVAADHRELVCGANLAMLAALTRQLGGDPPVRAVLDPRPGRCCVVLTRDG